MEEGQGEGGGGAEGHTPRATALQMGETFMKNATPHARAQALPAGEKGFILQCRAVSQPLSTAGAV